MIKSTQKIHGILDFQDFIFPLSGGGVVNIEIDRRIVNKKHFMTPIVRRMCNVDQCLAQKPKSEQFIQGKDSFIKFLIYYNWFSYYLLQLISALIIIN